MTNNIFYFFQIIINQIIKLYSNKKKLINNTIVAQHIELPNNKILDTTEDFDFFVCFE